MQLDQCANKQYLFGDSKTHAGRKVYIVCRTYKASFIKKNKMAFYYDNKNFKKAL